MMLWSVVLLLFFALLLGIAGWFFFLWGVKSGQFDDMEGPKYRIFDDEDEEDIPTEREQSLKKSGQKVDDKIGGHTDHDNTGKEV